MVLYGDCRLHGEMPIVRPLLLTTLNCVMHRFAVTQRLLQHDGLTVERLADDTGLPVRRVSRLSSARSDGRRNTP